MTSRLRVALTGAIAGAALALSACGDEDEQDEPAAASARETIVYAVGDGADGSRPAADLARHIVDQDPDRFLYLGDVYERGTPAEFRRNYHPLYGPLVERTDPTVGNHEYLLRAVGYYRYWAKRRGWSRERAKHRSYVDGPSGWQVIAYSSQTPDLEQEANWVARQVRKHAGTCRIVMAHKGRHVVADTEHTDNPEQEPVWRALANRTAINLVGHNHIHGRLEPIDGVHVIISGAGGHDLRALGDQHHAIAATKTKVPTATRLVLRTGGADVSQVDASGTVHDRATIGCTPAEEAAP